MKKTIILLLLTLSLVSCKNIKEKEQITVEEKEITKPNTSASLLEIGCYVYKNSNNTIILEITNLDNGVTANLTYALDRKDRNTGTLSAKLQNDKLFGIYTFTSEGVESKREVAFLVKNSQLIEGYGTLNEDGTAFSDKNTINYTSTMPLSKTNCDN